MLQISNDLIKIEMVINQLEQTQIDVLGTGDPVLDDEELYDLRFLSSEILVLKRTMADKATQLARVKSAYRREISTAFGSSLTAK